MQQSDAPGRPCSVLEFAALAYLAVPLFLFFAFFTKLWIAAPASAVTLIALYRVRPGFADIRVPALGLDVRQVLLCVILAAIFLWVCGYARPFGHTSDWLKHFAVINELGQHPWPPVNEETGTFLRYYLGYYLLPGLFAGLLGNRWIEPVVFLQTWIGLFLLLALLLQKIGPRRPLPFLVLFLLFSGPDLIPWLINRGGASFLAHKEWWTGAVFSYQGHASLFIWVPQHALAGMLGLALVLPGKEQGAPWPAFGLLGAAVLLYSPFAAIGLAPFALAEAARSGRQTFVDWGNIACAVVLGIPLLGYLAAGAGSVPHGFSWDQTGFSQAIYATFVTVEAGLYLVALRICGWEHLRHPAIVIAVLLLLPLYRVGLFNDFTMRACIPALMLIAIAAASAMTEPRGLRCIPLAILMLVGSVTSVLEIAGRGRDGAVPAHLQTLRSGALARPPYAVQYNAPLPNWMLRRHSD